MKKILLSATSIIFAGAILAGGTGAFLKDTETSTGNTFASGIVDLKIDNESYITNEFGALVLSTSTSWALSSLAGKLFFNFPDIKPGDTGEDTISLHVNNNNAWACMNINLTSTPENGQPDPEVAVDPTAGVNDGELQNNLYFSFWADDGDNVYEQGEQIFKQGLVQDIWNGQNWSLADSAHNIWNGSGPLLGNTTKYIAKAWCFGSMTPTPIAQDGLGKTGTNGPLVRGTGFSCNGADVGNIVQSDGITADVTFSVVQSRNNNGFRCDNTPPPEKFGECGVLLTQGLDTGEMLSTTTYAYVFNSDGPVAGNTANHHWIDLDTRNKEGVWDMGSAKSQIWLVPSIDHDPFPGENNETLIYYGDTPTGPWTLATRIGEDLNGPSTWISDNGTGLWQFVGSHRYVRALSSASDGAAATAQGLLISDDTEIDAVCTVGNLQTAN